MTVDTNDNATRKKNIKNNPHKKINKRNTLQRYLPVLFVPYKNSPGDGRIQVDKPIVPLSEQPT